MGRLLPRDRGNVVWIEDGPSTDEKSKVQASIFDLISLYYELPKFWHII